MHDYNNALSVTRILYTTDGVISKQTDTFMTRLVFIVTQRGPFITNEIQWSFAEVPVTRAIQI